MEIILEINKNTEHPDSLTVKSTLVGDMEVSTLINAIASFKEATEEAVSRYFINKELGPPKDVQELKKLMEGLKVKDLYPVE